MKSLQTILIGIGQVIFQNNIFSGLLFLVGIFYNSWLLGLGAILGTAVSTIFALILKYSKDDIENGLYGFNGALTGIAVLCFFELSINIVIALILASSLSTLLMKFLKKYTSPLTAPFVLATWIVIYLLTYIFEFPLLTSSEFPPNTFNILNASINSFGQVMFQENMATGVLFLLAILINNKIMALYAIYAAVLSSLSAFVLSESATKINAGLMGYNAILCAIALFGKKWQDFVWITAAIVISTVLNILLGATGIITLTAPFIITTWVIIILKKNELRILKKRIVSNSGI